MVNSYDIEWRYKGDIYQELMLKILEDLNKDLQVHELRTLINKY